MDRGDIVSEPDYTRIYNAIDEAICRFRDELAADRDARKVNDGVLQADIVRCQDREDDRAIMAAAVAIYLNHEDRKIERADAVGLARAFLADAAFQRGRRATGGPS